MSASVAEVAERFGRAMAEHDLDGAMALCADDVVFETTSPAPDGMRCEGKDEMRRALGPIFADEHADFSIESMHVGDNHAVAQWRYDFEDGHVRGMSMMTIHDGMIVGDFAYVKG
jgi:ketosteroid isomerase-like protein